MSLPIPEPPLRWSRIPRPLRLVVVLLGVGTLLMGLGAVLIDRDLWGQPHESGVVVSFQAFGDGFTRVGCSDGARKYLVQIADPRPGLPGDVEVRGCRGRYDIGQAVVVQRSADGTHVQLDPGGWDRFALGAVVIAGLGLLVIARRRVLEWIVKPLGERLARRGS